MIERQRRGDVSASCEGDEANAVVPPLLDEFGNRVLGHHQPIHALPFDLEIF